jgi:DMSO/TMAO reductase YedYZ molybdopterin-dependent catalytic subunit
MRSLFRPERAPDPAVLDDHRGLIRSLERRKFLRNGLSLGALSLLTGCDVTRPKAVEEALLSISSLNDGVQEWLFDPNKLAPTYPASMVLKPPKFNAKYDVMQVKPVDASTWRLELSGKIAEKKPWTLPQLAALPQRSMIIKHICVEGWDYIGQWSGVPLGDFLKRIGADTRAKYVAFKTADDYPSSIDMATALHPQTLLALDYADEALADPFGFPLRLRMSTKLGYKNPKWVTAMEVTDTYSGGFWEQRGFPWFAGL